MTWLAHYFIFCGMALSLLAACGEDDMYQQPRTDPLEPSHFFADGRSARPRVPGTIAQGEEPFSTSNNEKTSTEQLKILPLPLSLQLLKRGQEGFNAFCTPCHGFVGEGDGMVVRRGYLQPPSFHIDRLRAAPIGYLFSVITQGVGGMPRYSYQIPSEDRWAIATYVKALQWSQRVPISELPEDIRSKLLQEEP